MENHVTWELTPVDKLALATTFKLEAVATHHELRLRARGLIPALTLDFLMIRKKPNSVVVEISVDYRVSLQDADRSASGRIVLVREARVLEVAVRDAVAEAADAILARVAFSHGQVGRAA
ncbi:hypothetical protein [Mesorhizobium sp. LNHC209A00]|uniref:hypothetical protein n=1 Tax=Mesorhizobium TaxID=68287 RepID=UPI0003CFD0C9|nr:hypothetical protein [Mesorhizobium sp. LNHC209A00]ESZ01870.1 hypothetical protein X738_01725 [Mesorhizobium sp. LNHC209A00]